jgi:hypothetical protein
MVALLRMHLARVTKARVLLVSEAFRAEGDTLATIMVLALPPRESWRGQ